VLGQRGVGGQQHQAEAAGVVEADLPALVGLEHDMVVPVERMLGGAPGIVERHAARHAEMGDQRIAVVQSEEKVLGPPVDRPDRAALDLLGELHRHRHAEVAPVLQQPHDAPTDHPGHQATADGFDLGKLRHGSRVKEP